MNKVYWRVVSRTTGFVLVAAVVVCLAIFCLSLFGRSQLSLVILACLYVAVAVLLVAGVMTPATGIETWFHLGSRTWITPQEEGVLITWPPIELMAFRGHVVSVLDRDATMTYETIVPMPRKDLGSDKRTIDSYRVRASFPPILFVQQLGALPTLGWLCNEVGVAKGSSGGSMDSFFALVEEAVRAVGGRVEFLVRGEDPNGVLPSGVWRFPDQTPATLRPVPGKP